MKRRMGFVSNSSSSSFVIGIKGEDSLTEESLMKAFGKPSVSHFDRLNKAIVKFIVREAKEETEESILWNYGYATLEEAIAADVDVAKLYKDGYKMYSLDASYNEGDYIENLIGSGEAFDEVETPSLVIKCYT